MAVLACRGPRSSRAAPAAAGCRAPRGCARPPPPEPPPPFSRSAHARFHTGRGRAAGLARRCRNACRVVDLGSSAHAVSLSVHPSRRDSDTIVLVASATTPSISSDRSNSVAMVRRCWERTRGMRGCRWCGSCGPKSVPRCLRETSCVTTCQATRAQATRRCACCAPGR